MPIPVTCQCGQSFAAGDHLAGRTVQCPKCKAPLAIPALAAAPPVAPAAPNPSPFGSGGSIFDQAGMRTVAAGQALCPSCSAELPPNAVLCVKCGYHLQMGRRLGPQGAGPAIGGHGDAHGNAAVEALTKAAAEIDSSREAARKEYQQGLPWWALGGIFLLCITFLVAMLMLPNDVALAGGGMIIYGICFLISLYHGIRILIIAFTDNVVQGLCCMLIPCYAFVYVIMHWDECGAHFLWQLLASVIGNIAGGTMVFVAPYAKPAPGNTYDLRPAVEAVAVAEFDYPRPTFKTSNPSSSFLVLVSA